MNNALFLFHSTHDVIKAERLCLKNSLPVQVIPVPREISSQCGMALEIDQRHASQVMSLLKKNSIETHIKPASSTTL